MPISTEGMADLKRHAVPVSASPYTGILTKQIIVLALLITCTDISKVETK